ncbi:MAG: hypothetical protein ACKPKO_25185, partial [Candidatus Fonsibacter sp.]
FREVNKTKARGLIKVCLLNQAACLLRVGEFARACAPCGEVLAMGAHNVKALYRRAKAEFELGLLTECLDDCSRASAVEPRNIEVLRLVELARARLGLVPGLAMFHGRLIGGSLGEWI